MIEGQPVLEGVQCYKPTIRERISARLGFYVRYEDFGPEPLDAVHWAKTETHIHFDWRDRLRILLTGHVLVSTEHRTDKPIDVWKSVTSVGVLR